MSVTTPSLRASCERCRAQKLRCVTIPSEPGSTKPASCERCAKLQPPVPCVFRTSLHRGRRIKDAPSMGSLDAASEIPGMGAFRVAAGLVTPVSPMSGDSRTSASTPQRSSSYTPTHLSSMEVDDGSRSDGYFPPALDDADFWNPSIPNQDQLGPESFSFTDNLDGVFLPEEIASELEKIQRAQETELAPSESYLGIYLPPVKNNFSLSDAGSLSSSNPSHTGDTPSPMTVLTSLLADMSRTETRLSKIEDNELDNFPIGEVLHLCHRFHNSITETCPPPEDPTKPRDPSISLLIICCHMSLLRIYSSVFDHLLRDTPDRPQEQPSATQQVSHATHFHQHPPSQAGNETGSKVHKPYISRGLRLDQLQSHCLCTTWSRTKKAATMLVGCLRDIEEKLQLPGDLQITREAVVGSHGMVDCFGGSSHGSEGKLPMSSGGAPKGSSVFWSGELIDAQLHTVVRPLVGDLSTKIQRMI